MAAYQKFRHFNGKYGVYSQFIRRMHDEYTEIRVGVCYTRCFNVASPERRLLMVTPQSSLSQASETIIKCKFSTPALFPVGEGCSIYPVALMIFNAVLSLYRFELIRGIYRISPELRGRLSATQLSRIHPRTA